MGGSFVCAYRGRALVGNLSYFSRYSYYQNKPRRNLALHNQNHDSCLHLRFLCHCWSCHRHRPQTGNLPIMTTFTLHLPTMGYYRSPIVPPTGRSRRALLAGLGAGSRRYYIACPRGPVASRLSRDLSGPKH